MATNKTVTGQTLWHFVNARGIQEKVCGELKSGLAGRLVCSGGRRILDIGTAPVVFGAFSATENRPKFA